MSAKCSPAPGGTDASAHAPNQLPIAPLEDETLRAMARLGISQAELTGHERRAQEAVSEFVALDAEKKRLQCLLDLVEARRTCIQRYVHQIQCLKSPMSRLPDDIVSLILVALSIMSDEYPPVAWGFAQVCTQWRSIALSMQSLWTRIHLNFLSSISPKNLQEILRRSGNLPLSVHVASHGASGLAKDYNIWAVLARSSNQWRHVSFRLPGTLFTSALGNLTGDLANLQTLSLQDHDISYGGTFCRAPLCFLDCDLHGLHLCGIDVEVGPLHWIHLTQLTLQDLSWNVVSRLVPHFAQSLVKLEIKYATVMRWDGPQ